MPKTNLDRLKNAVKKIFGGLSTLLDERTLKLINDYFSNLPAEIELTDEQKEIIDLRCPEFETLAEENLSELNPATLKRLQLFSTFASSEPAPPITKAITKLYLAFLDIWNSELMNCGKELEEALNKLSEQIKTLPQPSSIAIAHERFQMLLLELLNRPRNDVYHFLNQEKKSIDKWFTDTNLGKIATIQQKRTSSNKKNKIQPFHHKFRDFLEDCAKDYDLGTNEFISLLRHKINRAYDNTQEYAQRIEDFITSSKTSPLSLKTFLTKSDLMNEDDIKKAFDAEITKFTKLFEVYCKVISDLKEVENQQQEDDIDVSSPEPVTESQLFEDINDGSDTSSSTVSEESNEASVLLSKVDYSDEYRKQRDRLKSHVHEAKLWLVGIIYLWNKIRSIAENDYLHYVQTTKITYRQSQPIDSYTTICSRCNNNCHEDCMLNERCDTFGCLAIQQDDGQCTRCTQSCGSSEHYYDKKLIKLMTKSMKEMIDDLMKNISDDKKNDKKLILKQAVAEQLDIIKMNTVNVLNEQYNYNIVNEVILTLEQLKYETFQLRNSEEQQDVQKLIDQLICKLKNYPDQAVKADSSIPLSIAEKPVKSKPDEIASDLDVKNRTTVYLIERYNALKAKPNETQSNTIQDIHLITTELNERYNGLSIGRLENKEDQMLQQFVDKCRVMPEYRLVNKAYKLKKDIDSILNKDADRFLALPKVSIELLELYAVKKMLKNFGPDAMKSSSILVEGLPKDVPEDDLIKRLIDLFEDTVGKIKIDPISKRPAVYLFLDKGKFNGEAQITFENDERAASRAINRFYKDPVPELNNSVISICQCADHVDDELIYYRGKHIELNRLNAEPVGRHPIQSKFTSDHVPSLCSDGLHLLLLSIDVNTFVQLDISEKPFRSKEINGPFTPVLCTCWCDKLDIFFMLTEESIHVLSLKSSSIKLFLKDKGLVTLTCSNDKMYVVQNFTTILGYDLINKPSFAPKIRENICKDDEQISSIAYHSGSGLIGLTVRKPTCGTTRFEVRDPLAMTKIIRNISLSINPNTKLCLCIPLPADDWLIVGDNGSFLLLDHYCQNRDKFKYSEEVLNATVCNENKYLAIRTSQEIILHNIA